MNSPGQRYDAREFNHVACNTTESVAEVRSGDRQVHPAGCIVAALLPVAGLLVGLAELIRWLV